MANNMWKFSSVLILLIVAVHTKGSPSKRRVCVVGAGLSGLISVRQLSLYPDEFEPIAFERQSDVGGLWIYTNSTTIDEYGLPVHSSVYKYMRINGPKEVQVLPDYRDHVWDESMGNYPHHPALLYYLRNYTERYKLRKYIQLSTYVEYASPLPGMRWLVVTRDLNTNQRKETQCDALIVGNGHNFKGSIPKIPGIETFPGRVIHSHVYRYPQEFANQTVVILGASFSGLDIGIDISRFAEKVYLSHRNARLTAELPKNIEQALGVVGAEGSELILSDSSRLKADALVLCTGYEYEFLFLNESSGIVVEDGKYVPSIYKHMINIEYPTMTILNLPNSGYPWQLPLAQAAYFIAVLRGKTKLPSSREMLENATLPAGVPKSKAHDIVAIFNLYYNDIAVPGGLEPLSDVYVRTIKTVASGILSDPLHFREKKLCFKSDGSYVEYP